MQFKKLITPIMALCLSACGGDGGNADSGNAPGVDTANKVIRIGLLNGESGPAAVIGKPYAIGRRMLATHINAGGSGVLPDGWKIELIERDHGYNPQRSVQLFNEIRDDVLFIGTSFGTPNTLPLRPMLERHNIVAFPVSLSSKMAEFAWTPPIAPSYIVEAQRAMDYAVQSAGGAANVKAGILYQQDDYGKDGYDGWQIAAKHHGVEIVAAETYAPGQSDYTAAVNALKSAGATHVLLTTLPSATGPILGAATTLDYAPIWLGNTPAWIDRFFDKSVIPPNIFTNFHLVSGVPFWGEARPGMDKFLALYDKHGKSQAPPDGYILMSYLQGLAQMEILRRAIESGDVSRAGFFKAMQSLTDYSMNGLVDYAVDLSKLPYVAGVETRVLTPDMAGGSWKVVAPFAKPASL